MEDTYEKTARVFKAFCDPNRLMIIDMLKHGEKCACNLLDKMNISQSTLSHHMKILCESGIVNCRRDGKWMYYSLNKKGCEAVENLLMEIMKSAVFINADEKCDCM
ncbi:MAG TPA: ArsR family transcriptional regulator [Clostridiaceae bacterium]|nr:ArsR family transcriptional regulator [Clostridiaceae bacterium]